MSSTAAFKKTTFLQARLISLVALVVAVAPISAAHAKTNPPGTSAPSQSGVNSGKPTPAPGGVSTIQFPWQGTDYAPCGQDCLYSKGNETISLEALYLIKKIRILDQARKTQNGPDLIFKTLGQFCTTSEEAQGAKGAQACYDRYRSSQIVLLYRIRESIMANKDMAGKLQSEAPSIARIAELSKAGKEPEPLKPAQPYVFTLKELDKRYADDPSLHQLIGYDYQQWLAGISPEPAPDDFVKYKTEVGPDGKKTYVIDTYPNGKPKHDDDAFKKAHDAWKALSAEKKKEYEAMWKGKTVPEQPKMDAPQVNQAAYNEARGIMVDAANTHIRGRKGNSIPAQISFPEVSAGSPRAPASAPSAQSSVYKGDEKILPIPGDKDGKNEGLYLIYDPDRLGQDILQLQPQP